MPGLNSNCPNTISNGPEKYIVSKYNHIDKADVCYVICIYQLTIDRLDLFDITI